ncbi:MAG: phosphoribosyltransferase [Deltaproteobacteria bacterium]
MSRGSPRPADGTVRPGVPCELVSWSRCYGLCRRVAAQVRAAGFRPEMIVAVGRGGWVPGRVLSDLLGLMDLTEFKVEHYRGAHRQAVARVRYPLAAPVAGRRVLLVDDVSDTGDTYRVALDHLSAHGPPVEVRTAALHHKTVSSFEPDFHGARVVRWRWLIYPWAAIEDLGGFVGTMVPRPEGIDAIAGRLRADYGIRVARPVLEDVVALLGDRGRT